MNRGPATRRLLVGLIAAAASLPALALSAPEYFGAKQCGSCHTQAYEQWKSTGHAVSLARLSKVQQKDPTCRSCHTMAPRSDDPLLAGVQCESCHGAGRFYAPEFVMRDKVLRKQFGLKEIGKNTCLACHTHDSPSVRPFRFEEKVTLVQHQKPAPG